MERLFKAPIWLVKGLTVIAAQALVYFPHVEDSSLRRVAKSISLAIFCPLLAYKLQDEPWKKGLSITGSGLFWGGAIIGAGVLTNWLFGDFVGQWNLISGVDLGSHIANFAANPFFTETIGLSTGPLEATFAIGFIAAGMLVSYAIGKCLEQPITPLSDVVSPKQGGSTDIDDTAISTSLRGGSYADHR